MKSKTKVLLTTAALTGFIACNTDTSQKKQEIADILQQKNDSEIRGEEPAVQEESTIRPSEFYQECDEEDSMGIERVAIQDLEGTPLFGKKAMIIPNYGNLLGFSQAENIMRDYNGKEIEESSRVEKEDTIAFPLIYPELRSYFPEDLTTLLTEKYNPLMQYYPHFIMVSKCDNGKNALAYYQDGKLKLATYVSIGKGKKRTPEGDYLIRQDAIFRRSTTYGGAPMPYSIQITGPVYSHEGFDNGFPQSHGCVRVPGLYQKRMYENLPEGTRMSLKGLYVVTLKKQE